ncbi:helix-turn-helix domain-containing protein [Sporomusa rhizae]|uniref:helix-turn-helix domain-containing protein n=1 Tax=Sporomusa rhizae TaxID=357999 RepID=UPI003529FB76
MEALYTSLVDEIAATVERRVIERLQQLPVGQDRRMSAQEAADYIGIVRNTLYVLCKEKQIPHITIGAKGSKKPTLIFQQSTLDEWLRQQEVESVAKGGTNLEY